MFPGAGVRVYLATGATDMRKAISGLSILVGERLKLDPFSGHLFAYSNYRRTMVKIFRFCRLCRGNDGMRMPIKTPVPVNRGF
jgi:transposase